MVVPHRSSAQQRYYVRISCVFLVFCFCLVEGDASIWSDQGSLFRLQQHKINGSLFKHGGRPVHLGHLLQLRQRDKARSSRVLATSSTTNPISFPLGGIADPSVAGLYFTEINLGTPPSKYYVQVDTGSDLLWVNCASCRSCPKSTQLGVRLALYDPQSSSTSTQVMCGDVYCNDASSAGCQGQEVCNYQLGYGDGSSSQGYFVRDELQLNIVAGNKPANATATVAFGCGTRQSGELRNSDQALDGIIGFGQSSLSVLSQLMSKKEASGVFAHCLEAEGDGGGILAIGEVKTPGLVYTPILQQQTHYNVNLKSINVNHVSISIDSSVSQNGGTIIDSGTTLAYFSDSAYQQLLQAVFDSVQLDTTLFQWEGMTCVSYSGSVDGVFPSVTLTFDGNGAEMIIKPHEYLVQAEGVPGMGWCVGFQSSGSNNINLNILGDLVLKDRLVVYDLEQQRIGWVDHDCSSNITMSTSTGNVAEVSASAIPISSSASIALSPHDGFVWPSWYCLLWLTMALLFSRLVS